MDLAIQKAKEGGYDIGDIYNRENVLMNPKFWQALGKAQDWSKETIDYHFDTESWDDYNKRIVQGYIERKIPTWRYHWHRFIDHLAEGKDADEFFENLFI